MTPEPPDLSGGGGQLRQAHLLRAVAERFTTHLIVPETFEDQRVREWIDRITPVPHDPPPPLERWGRRKLRLLRHQLIERLPWDEALATAQRRHLGAALASEIEPGDVVVLEHLKLAPLLADLPGSVHRVLTVHFDGARQAAQRAAVAPTARNRWFWRSQARRVRRLQLTAREETDVLIAVSEQDASALGAVVVPNGVDVDSFSPTPLPAAPRAVLTATFDYAPNVDGAVWFVQHVWPRIRADEPDAELHLVGRRPLPAVRALTDLPGVHLHVDVPSVHPHLQQARVAVVPLRLGGGTRVKALEALAAGRVLVGTTVGVEGLDVEAGVHALIGDEPEALATAVVTALRDDALATRLTAAGRDLVERRYGWDTIGARFLEVLEGLVDAPSARS
ncbi:MAG: glycosyltransferase family 4 protein [Actinobacteria bacterium]|nr:glycosyltransferase family 4 protein [Actinomycetota bacterium]